MVYIVLEKCWREDDKENTKDPECHLCAFDVEGCSVECRD